MGALKMVEEEEAVATRDKLKAQIEEMKKEKLQKAEEGLGQKSILVKDFTEMDEYFGKFGAIVGITKVSDGCSQINFVNVAAAEEAKKEKLHWPKDSEEYEATRAKSVKPSSLKEEGETSSLSSSEDDYGQRWTCLDCHHDNFSWSKECSQCAAKQQCEEQAELRRSSEVEDQGEEPSSSESLNLRKFGRNGEGIEKNAQEGKLKGDADETVPVVDLADSSEEEREEIQDMSLKEQKVEDTSIKDQKVKDMSSKEQKVESPPFKKQKAEDSIKEQKTQDTSWKEMKVEDIMEKLSNASREEQDEILAKMGIVRRIVKKRMTDSLEDAGLYSDGEEEKEEEQEG